MQKPTIRAHIDALRTPTGSKGDIKLILPYWHTMYTREMKGQYFRPHVGSKAEAYVHGITGGVYMASGASTITTSLAEQSKLDRSYMESLWWVTERLIRHWAFRFVKTEETRLYDVDDLTQAGYLALEDAVVGFSSEKGSFSTYLGYCVRKRFREVAGIHSTKRRPEIWANSLNAPFSDDTETAWIDQLADPDSFTCTTI